ncbi:insulinase family protein [Pontibacter sp. 172403-2]|uniref:M16 family metallopeptidase n=1 Tax=Pontibacter rufus TaxID=2791028 RepID=UPI0018AFE20B|nr:pitrilysin family protein [Pontibacter sp. 172403-2]MBF9253548.1 insulinase family protein [Pontibacter sp. 172403-2]
MLDRTKAPETYEIDAVTLHEAEVTNLANGARLHVIKSETQPVIRLDFVFKAGKWFETGNGVSDLTAKMLLEGTINRTAKQIAETIAYYGASFEGNHGYDRTEFTLYCLAKHLNELLPLVLDVLQNPSFPKEEFALLKQRSQQNLKLQRQKNNYLATHCFTKSVYGPGHPYIYGFDADAFDDLQLTDLISFYHSHYVTQELEVFACGSIEASTQKLLADEISNLHLQPASKIIPVNKPEIKSAEASYALVEMPDSLQSSIRVGKRFPSIHDEDYLDLLVLNELLGGYFGSRLMRNIREDKGYTYGIHSSVSPREHDTLFYIGTDVNYTVTDNTIEEIKKELQALQQDEIPAEELQTVKNYMLGKFLNDIATIFEQCDRYKRIVLYQLPQNHYNDFVTAIKTITPSRLQQLAKQYLDYADMQTALAGKRS